MNAADGKRRAVDGFVAVEYDIAEGSVAMYYPEGNALIALESHDRRSGTPAYKSVPVRITVSTLATACAVSVELGLSRFGGIPNNST